MSLIGMIFYRGHQGAILACEFGCPILPAIPEVSGRRDIPGTAPFSSTPVLIDTVERTRTEELLRKHADSCRNLFACLSSAARQGQICHSDETATARPCPWLTTNRYSTA